MLATGFTVAGGGAATAAAPAADRNGGTSPLSEQYINYVAPRVEDNGTDDEKVSAKALQLARTIDRKHAGGNPVAARQLARLEQQATQSSRSIRSLKQAPRTQTAKLLTILVEFNDHANDDFSHVMVPKSVTGDRECTQLPAGTLRNGPLHNRIPNPASYRHLDNNTFWVPDFSPRHFDTMLFTKRGITERVRKDLKGPDGRRGVDISGYTMKNMYEEMSKGAYTVTGAATDWVQVAHSEAWYGADTCTQNDEGVWEAGPMQDMNGHPDNPNGAGQLAIDAVNALAQQQPGFNFKDYDREDQGDLDGDGNVFEPDGIIDHVVLVHAGEDKSGGGGAEGTDAIWAHSSTIPGGQEIAGTGLKVANYIVQPEDAGVGVFAHEYGHDLGLPDLYDSVSGGDSDVDFWDLMASGSHSGPIFQSMPTHMGLWDKYVLGWADPKVFEPGEKASRVRLGQAAKPPAGTEDGIRVSLPDKVVAIAEPHSGESMWWTGSDQSWAKNTLTREISVPTTGTSTLSMWNNYVIEEDWDFGFVEVSTDGGTTWAEQPVMDAAGNVVTTPADYPDPNGRMHDFGDKKFGLTGDSGGWRQDHIDLTSFAGKTIQVRLLYATDEAFQERGWFADDFAVTNGASTVWSDDVENGANGWTAETGTFVDGSALGAGWALDTGTQIKSHYYLAEWRNFAGFDNGLKYAYDTTYSESGPWKVEKIRYNAPGMLVWYRDTTYGNQNPVLATTYDLPSTGTKGGLLLVDSHFDPLRRTGKAADADPSTLNNLPSRPQSSNAAFGLRPTYRFNECLAEVPGSSPFREYCSAFAPQRPVSSFTDKKGWYPGIEIRAVDGEDTPFFRDIDASVVVPNRKVDPYSTRVVDENGHPLKKYYGTDLGNGIVLGSGNPDRPFGVELSVMWTAKNNSFATVSVHPAR